MAIGFGDDKPFGVVQVFTAGEIWSLDTYCASNVRRTWRR